MSKPKEYVLSIDLLKIKKDTIFKRDISGTPYYNDQKRIVFIHEDIVENSPEIFWLRDAPIPPPNSDEPVWDEKMGEWYSKYRYRNYLLWVQVNYSEKRYGADKWKAYFKCVEDVEDEVYVGEFESKPLAKMAALNRCRNYLADKETKASINKIAENWQEVASVKSVDELEKRVAHLEENKIPLMTGYAIAKRKYIACDTHERLFTMDDMEKCYNDAKFGFTEKSFCFYKERCLK